MSLKELREKVMDKDTSFCYLIKGRKVYKFEIFVCKGDKSVSKIYEEEPRSFTIGFENPCVKNVWKPYYAKPFIDVMGVDDDGKLMLTNFKKGGWDVPNRWITIHGDFFLNEDDAKKYIENRRTHKGC